MFSYETTVSYSRTDRNGKVPMHEILNLLQDCSTFHSEDIGHGVSYMKREARAWVLVAYKVIVNRPIMFGQKIIYHCIQPIIYWMGRWISGYTTSRFLIIIWKMVTMLISSILR